MKVSYTKNIHKVALFLFFILINYFLVLFNIEWVTGC